MDEPELRRRMNEVIAEHGPWHSHNIHLGYGIWTRTDNEAVENSRLRRFLQVVTDGLGVSLQGIRILDLACEEGSFGLEAARHGADVVAVEGRPGNVARTRFAAEALGLDSHEVFEGDVREVSRSSHGEFDVILSLGILYHLDTPDVFEHVHELAQMCRRVLFVSTHFSRLGERAAGYRGRRYRGSVVNEHPPGADEGRRAANLRASLDNPESFWLTRPSLYNLLSDAGFSSVLEVRMPRDHREHNPGSQINLVAFRGRRIEVPRSPHIPHDPPARWPERGSDPVHPAQKLRHRLGHEIRRIARRS